MSPKAALLKKLRDAQSGKPGADPWEQKKNEWIADLEKLTTMISDWLSQPRDEGLMAIEKKSVELREEDMGPYDVPTLEISTRTLHPRTIHVVPRGMRVQGAISAEGGRIVGAYGRVDLLCGASKVTLLRSKKTDKKPRVWQIVLPSGNTMPLDEEKFFDLFNELIE